VAIVGGFDIHRKQITFDYADTVTGQVRRGRIDPACRATLRGWLEQRFAGRDDVTFAVEGCTGWLFVVQELQRAGITALLAEPAETAQLRGPKKRAKTDKTDSRHLRTLVADGKVPASWIPPEQACELRALLQLYRDLAEEHTAWAQRIHATLFHQGVPGMAGRLSSAQARAVLAGGADIGLSAAGAQAVQVALRQIQALEAEMGPVHAQIAAFSRRQIGCKTLQQQLFGVGPLIAAVIWAFLGDARRFSSSAQAVRHTGLDVTVYSSDGKRTPGHLSHQGPPILRWALFEAGHQASRASSPDHCYYADVAARIDAGRAALSVARKLARRSHHILRRLGDQAYAPVPAGR
jgi:transposase